MGNCELIIKCSVRCDVIIDDFFHFELAKETVGKTMIEPGQHLLEFKSDYGDIISTHVITAPNSGRIVVYDTELERLLSKSDETMYEVQYRSDDESEESDDGSLCWPKELYDKVGELYRDMQGKWDRQYLRGNNEDDDY